MYKQPSETNNFFSLRCLFRRVFRIKNSLLRHFNEISAYFCFFLLCSLDAVISHDDCRQSKSNYTEGSSTGLLVFNCQFEKKELHSRANAVLSLLLSDTQPKKFSLFYILRMINLGISITLEET